MKIRTTRLARLLVAGAFVAIAGLLWLDGPPPTFAQTETDTTAPTVSSVAITSDTGDDEVYLDDDGVYGIGDNVEVTVTFSENVTVHGSPQLELDIGGSAKSAAYKSTTGSKVVFSYTVATGDTDTNGISIGADKLNLKGGAIKDAAGNSSDLSHSALSAQSGHKVDGIRPTITSAYLIESSSNQDDVHTIDEYLPAGVRFSEHVYVGGYPGPQMRLNFEGTTKSADFGGANPECSEAVCVFGPGGRYGISLDFEYMIAKGDLDLDGVAINANSVVLNGGSIRDGAGNDAVLTHSAVAEDSNYIVDGVPATVKSVAITSNPGSDNTYGVGDTIEVTVTFSESVRVPRRIYSGGVVRMPLLELNVGGLAKIARTHERSTITGTTVVFSYTVQDGDNDADGIYIGANKLTTQSNGGITDNYSGCCPGGNDADLHHSAVAESARHKVRTLTQPSKSSDATLSALTLSDINIGTFASGTTSYTAQVANSVSQTTVTPTVNDSGATYVIKLGGVTDADGVVSLATGSNVITVEVTAEDDSTTKTYTVTVTRSAQASTDATLSGLTLSGVNFGTFASGTTSYTADVANSVTETTVTPTVNHSGATYVIKLGGVTDSDGVVSLATGSNVITVEVTAEDDSTTKTYTVTVTRAAAPISAPDLDITFVYTVTNLWGYSPSFTLGVNVKNQGSVSSGSTTLRYYRSTDSAITSGDTEVGTDAVDGLAASEISRETIDLIAPSAPGTYYYGGCVDAVSDESDTTNNCSAGIAFMVPAETSTDATLSGLSLSDVNFGTFASGTTAYSAQVANSVTETTVTPTVSHSGATYVIKLGGVTDADGVVSLSVGSNVITVEVTAEDDDTTQTYTIAVTRASPSSDATLSALTLSSIDFGTFVSGTTSYSAQVANSVSQTTVTPTVNDSGATYVIKLGGVTDADGVVSVSVGSNVITVEVTAEDDDTTRTYTVTVTRARPPSTDATLSALTLSGIDFGTFDSTTTTYSAQVANSVSQTTVTPTANDSGASYVIKLGGVTDADGEISLAAGSNAITVEVTAEDDETTQTYTVTVTRAEPPSTDATLSTLTLSGIDFGTFASGTTSYSAQVANSVSQTTVTPTVNDSGASYMIKLGGVKDADGVVSLSVGSNVITVEVTAEDDETTQTYTVTVTRAEPPSTDATLSGLTLSGIDFGTFDSSTTTYSAQVANSVSQTTVTPTLNDSGASYVIKLGGVTDADGVVSLSVGSNVITVEVTAEDDNTTQSYTVTVTRAEPPSTDATLSGLTLSGIDFGTFVSGTTSYSAQVANSVSQTTVTPTLNDSGASYVTKLGGVTDVDGVVSLSVDSNVITVEVTAEDDETTQTYTVTVTRAEPPTPELSDDATLSSLTLSVIDFGTFDSTTTSYTAQVANSVSQTTVTPAVRHSEASYVVKLGGVEADDGEISLVVGNNVITVEVTAEDDETTQTYTVTVTRAEPPSTDATLGALTLSGIDFGTFASGTIYYGAQVANNVTQTTVTPTVNDSGASYVIKLGGTTDVDGVITLSVGGNVITVEVTAEDGEATRTYTVTVTRAAPLSADATLSSLTLSGIDFGTFDPTTKSYAASVANSFTQTAVTATTKHSSASYVVKLGGVEDEDGEISLAVGSNVITVEVTAEDDSTTQTYTVTVTRSAPPALDASLSALSLSDIDFGTFSSGTNSYSAQVANSVSQTTVTPTVNHPGASYVIKLDGVTDADGVVSLSVGGNVITVEVTAQDGETSRTYTVTVTRAEPSSTDATLSALTLSGIDFGTFDSTTTSYTATVANSVAETTVTPTVNQADTSYVVKLGGVDDEDGEISLAVGSNVIAIEVTAEDGITTQTYTVTVTREDSTLRGPRLCVSGGAVSDQTNTGLVSDCEALLAAEDALAGAGSLNWSADTPITDWDGIRGLEGTPERVTKLYLHSKGLSGTIPSELGGMSSLTHLYLHRNKLTGAIPAELSSLSSLEWLSLYGNGLTGGVPAELAGLSKLKRLYLHDNQLSGMIPGKLGGMSSLTHLFLHRNQLTGAIPGELGGMSNLEWLSLYGNGLTGGIPTELGSLSKLKRLYLHANQLSGTVPAALGNLSSLTHLLLLRNDLSGPIPIGLGKLSNMVWLALYDNDLSGPIPSELGDLANLQRLYLHYNQLSGEIPVELGNLAALTNLWLNDNRLTGTIPSELDKLTNLTRWRLRGNELTGCVLPGLAEVANSDIDSLGLDVCSGS